MKPTPKPLVQAGFPARLPPNGSTRPATASVGAAKGAPAPVLNAQVALALEAMNALPKAQVSILPATPNAIINVAEKYRGYWTNGQKTPPNSVLSAPSVQKGVPQVSEAENAVIPSNIQGAASARSGIGLEFSAVRSAMVARLAKDGLVNPLVLNAMRQTERHLFVDTALVNQAYEDTSLPIGLGQTISKPNVVGRMLALLLQAGVATPAGLPGRVLEIGTGCGYQAALLSHLAVGVVSVERLEGLHLRARANLQPLGYTNIQLVLGDGMLGSKLGAPYLAIIAAAGGEAIPQAWIDQLAVGGRIVAPVHAAPAPGQPPQQLLTVVDKTSQGLRYQTLDVVKFVPLKSGVA